MVEGFESRVDGIGAPGTGCRVQGSGLGEEGGGYRGVLAQRLRPDAGLMGLGDRVLVFDVARVEE